MKLKKLLAALTAASLVGATTTPHADDIDLYTGGNAVTGAAANVLLILDNSSNWSASNQNWPDGGKQGISELQTLSEVSATLTDSINLGLMSFATSGSNWEGQVRFHIRPMTSTNRGRFQQIMDYMAANAVSGSDPDEVSSSTDYDILMNSAFRYFNGKDRYPNINNAGTDRKDHMDNAAVAVFDPSPNPSGYNWAYDSANQSFYNPPPEANAGCAKNFIIFIGNGFPSSVGTAAELTAAGALIGKTADTSTVVAISPKNPLADEWARFMYKYGVESLVDDPANPGSKITNRITTYTIDVCKDACDSSQATLLKSMAKVGGGKYYKSTSKAEIKAALAAIFAEIQAVNSVFASATLPISVNTQGTYENQVYIGVFRPDGASRPRWYGNLKEYKFGRYCDADFNGQVGIDATRVQPITGTFSATDERISDDVTSPSCGNLTSALTVSGVTYPIATAIELKLYLADQYGYRAIDETGNTGFIDLAARSYWTTDSTYWTFQPSEAGSISDSPDGPAVERGAAAQKLRAKWGSAATSPHPDGRNVYTCLGTCLAAAQGTANRALSANVFYTGNSEVTTALVAPSGSVSATLARTGESVLVTTGLAHGFNIGDSIVIAGATPTAYNGTKTVVTKPSTTTFTYAITETPATSVTGVNVSATGAAVNVTSLTLSTTTAGATATVTATPAVALALSTTPFTATIAGASQSYLNGTFVGSTDGAGRFVYTVTNPSNPGATLTGNATVKCGTGVSETATASWSSGTGKFNFITTNTAPAQFSGSGCRNFAGSVLVTGAADAAYNGTWTIASTDKGNDSFFAGTQSAVTITSPDAGAAKTVTPAGVSVSMDLARTAGSTLVTATSVAAHGIGAGSITISGSSVAAYNGTWTAAAPSTTTLTFTGPALGPTTPPTGTITAALSGAGSGPSTTNLINWTRGKDLWEDENLDSALTDVRASVHGDVLHSRPAVVNYGGTIGIVGFYGVNDGFLRAIKGGITGSDGDEMWAFLPQEFANYTKLSRLFGNSELIRFPNSACSVSPTPTQRNYFWDGSITVYQSSNYVYYTSDPAVTSVSEPTAGCSTAATPTCYKRPEKTYIYASMRRGGRSLYAMDVSVPSAPTLLWKVDNTMANFSQLGYTWSEPKLARIKGKKADTTDDLRDVVVFGAGYDPTDDDQPSGCPRGDHSSALAGSFSSGGGTTTCPTAGLASYSGIGRGVFVVDAFTGAYINFLAPSAAAVKYSFPSDVNMIDMDGDGYVDRIYAADSGAQLFRFDVVSTEQLTASTAFNTYYLSKFGDLARASSAYDDRAAARKVLYPPDVVPFAYKKLDNSIATAVMVLLGTGDREKPLPNRDSSNDLNTLTCGALYSGGPFSNYYGQKIRDKFFGFVDGVAYGASSGSVTVATESDLGAVNNTSSASTTVNAFDLCTAFESTCASPLKKGWVMNFKNTVGADDYRQEEKMVNAPKTVSGIVFFGTNTPKAPNPSAGICTNLGEALAYAVDPFSGAPKFDRNGDGVLNQDDYAAVVSGGGLPPTVTAGVVGIGGSFYRFVIGGGGTALDTPSSIAGAKNPINLKGTRSRVYWYYPADDK